MKRYIDMHCHILPHVDDGAADMEETVKMLKEAYKDGIRYMIATPHFHPKRGSATPLAVLEQVRLVREEAKKIDEKFKIFMGNEIYFGQDVPELLAQRKILTMNGSNYILVEFSPSVEEIYIKQSLQQMKMCGYEVILAHVERYECIKNDISIAEYLYDMGIHLQVNAGSIIGNSGRSVKKFVKELLEAEMVFCVGTDAHDHKKRVPHMHKAAHYVEKKYGEEYARRIFFNNAAMMLKKQK